GVRVVAGNLILGRVSVTSTQASGNVAGGGVFCAEGTLTVFDSALWNNQARNGGGMAVDAGCALNMDGSTIYLNNAGSGAGLAVLASGVANLTNSTVSANLARDNYLPATGRGGGIEVETDGYAGLNHVTLVDNWAVDTLYDGWQLLAKGTVTLRSTIVYGTQGPNCKVTGGSIVSGGYNLSGDATCDLIGQGDLPNRDPLLGALSDNGGFTFTHALAANSPAVDAGGPPDPGTPTHDQRGLPHRDGDLDGVVRGDIGSYEYQTRGIWLPLVVR
nr:choice-of-anchor Q domain-containing protein [Anaerolinea sp.]